MPFGMVRRLSVTVNLENLIKYSEYVVKLGLASFNFINPERLYAIVIYVASSNLVIF